MWQDKPQLKVIVFNSPKHSVANTIWGLDLATFLKLFQLHQ